MSNQTKKGTKAQQAWFYASISLAILPWMVNFLTGILYPVDGYHRVEIRQASMGILFLSVLSLIFALTTFFKVGGMKRALVLMSIVPTIYIGYLALFSYTWLGR